MKKKNEGEKQCKTEKISSEKDGIHGIHGIMVFKMVFTDFPLRHAPTYQIQPKKHYEYHEYPFSNSFKNIEYTREAELKTRYSWYSWYSR